MLKVRMHHRLAERDELQRLDELLARDVLTKETAGAGDEGRENVACGMSADENDRSHVRIFGDHPPHQVVRGSPAFVDTDEPDADSR